MRSFGFVTCAGMYGYCKKNGMLRRREALIVVMDLIEPGPVAVENCETSDLAHSGMEGSVSPSRKRFAVIIRRCLARFPRLSTLGGSKLGRHQTLTQSSMRQSSRGASSAHSCCKQNQLNLQINYRIQPALHALHVLLARLQLAAGQFEEGVANLQQQYVRESVFVHDQHRLHRATHAWRREG